jgi:hypothetical protein
MTSEMTRPPRETDHTDHPVPIEADFERAPTLLDGAANTPLTVEQCDLTYWFAAVAQGTFRDRASGHAETTVTPGYMREPGPLREALRLELAYRALDEEVAVRVLSYYVAIAPDTPELEFFTTQLVDECRHHMVFRNHLVDLGVPQDGLMDWVRDTAAVYYKEILSPVKEFALTVIRDERDFVGGVTAFAIILEGILAAAAELSERKWGILDPVMMEIARGASIDEIRHLAVGSSIVRRHLIEHPEDRPHVLNVLRRGRELWNQLSDEEFVMNRERLFQEGLPEHAERLRDYEVFPGRRLLDTTPQDRWDIAARWNDELADARLAYMGIPEAIDLLRAQAPRIV